MSGFTSRLWYGSALLLISDPWLMACGARSTLAEGEVLAIDAGASDHPGSTAGSPSGGATTNGGAMANGGATSSLPPSCVGLATLCQGESCCTTIPVPGGTFPMGRSESGTDNYTMGDDDELPEHPATIANFSLDKYEVTVGRFRNFLRNYDAWHGAPASNPRPGDGFNPNVPINNPIATGWAKSWWPAEDDLPADASALIDGLNCDASYQTWTNVVGANESFPLNCVTWFEAFAFCIWDGGRLPTEAEWEYAAASGAENRRYPWGGGPPSMSRADFAGSDASPRVGVGSKPGGANAFGHLDLAGSLWEWVFDWYASGYYGTIQAPTVCNNCANLTSGSYRVARGGSWFSDARSLRATYRSNAYQGNRELVVGFRCARATR